ncbi:MAG: benzoyl-CoA reductase subunit D [Vicinamibacterales bacterium]|jgi:benzoyl-CoA reductase subunit D
MITTGIDVGSAAIKVAVMDSDGQGAERLLGAVTERVRKRDSLAVVETAYESALAGAGVAREAVEYVATTGEGESVPFRTGHFYGMTTHARGGLFLEPAARGVVDIGALHARAVRMDERAKVLGYRMTSQCASGSGQFLENIARYLGVTLEEIGRLSKTGDQPEPCSSICAVLAETDVINMVSRGITIPNILRGIHQSMAGRYLKLVVSAGIQDVVLITGGLAADEGLLAALADAASTQKAAVDIRSHPQSMLAGAIGAALWGAFRARRLAERGGLLGRSAA